MSPSEGAGCPSNSTSPSSAAVIPDRIETIVDLPAPLRPTRPRHRPGYRPRSTPCSARVLPNRLWIPAALATGVGGQRGGDIRLAHIVRPDELQTPPWALP